ncbi:Uncharacterised protein [Bacteroides heparinolyticus]|uniref:Uncharacterized protein n=1 Tax=Prevotella heparinolytica TaxID=28113 RepID=A0A449I3H1_9BACE|nr:Uncharacterised protein [Bacteroides heparinolyticus]
MIKKSNNIITCVRDRRLLLLKMRGCILTEGYLLNMPVYGGLAEESLLRRPPSPTLFDSCKPLS